MDNEIINSFNNTLKKRLTTPIYGTFLVSWLIFHWEFIFVIFFVSEDKIWQSTGLLKNDYLIREFFNFSGWYFYLSWILPFVLTWLIIWKFPNWISLPAFKKEEEYRLAKNRIRVAEQKKLETEEIKLEQEKKKKLDIVSETVQKEKEIQELDPSINWKEEYEIFKNSQYYSNFNLIIESVYQRNGNISWYGENATYQTHIPKGILAYSHTNGLVEFGTGNKTINLTTKGKFFVKQFSLDNKIY